MVSMFASVNYVGNSSLVVGIKVIAEDFKLNCKTHQYVLLHNGC